MNVTIENIGPCRKSLKVEFSAEEVAQKYDELLGAFAKQMKVNGFRAGRVPLDVARRKHHKDICKAARDQLLSDGYRQAHKEQSFVPVSEVDLQESELSPTTSYSYTLVIDVEPNFDLPAYKGIEIDTRDTRISDEDVTQAIDHYLESTGKYEDISEDRPVVTHDMVAVDYTATVDGQPMAELSPDAASLSSGTDYWVIANTEYSFLPQFGPQLIGLKVGESKEISIPFDGTLPIEALRGKTGVFSTTVKKIRARNKPPMDEAFFQSMNVKNEAELRDSFRLMLQREADNREQGRRNNLVLNTLTTQTSMDLPESVLQTETNRVVYELVQSNSRQGVSEANIRENLPKITEAAKPMAVGRIKIRYILKRIAREENLSVPEILVDKSLLQMALQAGAPNLKDWLQTNKLDEDEVRNNLRQDILNSRVMDLIMKQANYLGAENPEPESEGTPT